MRYEIGSKAGHAGHARLLTSAIKLVETTYFLEEKYVTKDKMDYSSSIQTRLELK